MFSIQQERFSPCTAQLVAALDAWQNALYPPESQHCTDLTALADDELILLMARNSVGRAVGCLSLLIQDEGNGELKRLFVDPEMRGQGVAEQLMQQMEVLALKAGVQQLRLETGQHHHAALRFYQRLGYRFCDAFPPYGNDPFGVYLSKRL